MVLDVRKLESLAEEREYAIQEAYEEQERLRRVHIASEVELEHSTRAKRALHMEVQVRCIDSPRVSGVADLCFSSE